MFSIRSTTFYQFNHQVMRRLILLLLFCCAAFSGFAQCLNTATTTAKIAPSVVNGIVLSPSIRPFDYLPLEGCVIGYTYRATSNIATDYITVRSGTFDGPVVAHGVQPLNFTAPASGTLYVHLTNDVNCNTSYVVTHNLTITLITATSTPAGCFNTSSYGSITAAL